MSNIEEEKQLPISTKNRSHSEGVTNIIWTLLILKNINCGLV